MLQLLNENEVEYSCIFLRTHSFLGLDLSNLLNMYKVFDLFTKRWCLWELPKIFISKFIMKIIIYLSWIITEFNNYLFIITLISLCLYTNVTHNNNKINNIQYKWNLLQKSEVLKEYCKCKQRKQKFDK